MQAMSLDRVAFVPTVVPRAACPASKGALPDDPGEGRAAPSGRSYDPERLRRFYDLYGEREWWRLATRPSDEVSFFVHSHYLGRSVAKGDRVLELGAGPGRFTIELARLGARVVVGDLSGVQLELNARFVRDAGCEEAVEARVQVDAADLSRFPDASFDAVLCYGGVLSYLFDAAPDALCEMRRVLRPGGRCLASVMSRLYNMRKHDVLAHLLPIMREDGVEALERLFGAGDYVGALAQGHEMRLYGGGEVADLLRVAGLRLVALASSNCLSAGNDRLLEPLRADPLLWARFLDWELREGRRAGAHDAGHHVIAVASKDGAP